MPPTFKELFLSHSTSTKIQLFRCAFAGVVSFGVDTTLLYVITEMGVHYLTAAAAAFLFGLVTNFALSKKFIFTSSRMSLRSETLCYGLIALASLSLTELSMYVLTDFLGVYYIFSKLLSSSIVLTWSFSARKFWLYRS